MEFVWIDFSDTYYRLIKKPVLTHMIFRAAPRALELSSMDNSNTVCIPIPNSEQDFSDFHRETKTPETIQA